MIWENGACLNLQNSLGYPQSGPGSNLQGMTLFCTGSGEGAMIRHSDQYRGLEYSTTDGYSEPSPDYFSYVDLGKLTPVGYGYRSIEYIVRAAKNNPDLDKIDAEGIIATPANSRYNELSTEAARLSLASNGREAIIDYEQLAVRIR